MSTGARRGAVLVVVATLAMLASCSRDHGSPRTTGTVSVSTATPSGSSPSSTEPAVGTLRLHEVARVDQPIALAVDSTTGDLYVAERPGVVRHLDPATGKVSAPLVDISADVSNGGERGLLGLTFSPKGDRLYLSYTNRDGDSRVDEWRVGPAKGASSDVPVVVTPSSRRTVFGIHQPYPNHNGGDIRFGPDGYLYLGLGDGGGAGDPHGNAQNRDVLLGKVLRIDPLADCTNVDCVDGEYAIPPHNPFVGGGGAPEIWLYGVRNPWRFTWDTDGDLWIADVGQARIEEIDWLPAPHAGRGANLGWNQMEGDEPYDGGAPPPGSVLPVATYTHDAGCSIVGGSVYRGKGIPALDGVYLYGDYCAGNVLGIRLSGGKVVARYDLGLHVGDGVLGSFGVDADGEVYALSLDGPVYRIEQG